MKTKQVVAFLMAATLTVTSGGVSALASQNAAEALQEETAIEELITEEGTDGEIREAEGDQMGDKLTSEQSARVTLTLGPTTQEVEYGGTANLHLEMNVESNTTVQMVQILDPDGIVVAEKDKDQLASATGKDFSFKVEKAGEYSALATFRTSEAEIIYSKSNEVEVTLTVKKLGENDIKPASFDVSLTAADLNEKTDTTGDKTIKQKLDELAGNGLTISDLRGRFETYYKDIVNAAVEAEESEFTKSIKDYGTWEWSEYDSEKKEVTATFTPADGKYELAEDVSGEITVPVKITQNVMYIAVTENKADSIDTRQVLNKRTLSKAEKDVALETVTFPEKDVANSEVTWESTNSNVFSVKESSGKNSLAVATRGSNGSSTIKVTAKDGGGAFAEVLLTASNKMTTDDVDTSMFPKELEYRGNASVADYLFDYVEAANAALKGIGKYEILNADDVNADKIKEAQNEQIGKGVEFNYDLKFTLDDPQNASDDGKNPWVGTSSKSTTIPMKLTVKPKTITRDEALKEILGDNMGKTSFPIGTSLEDLLKSQPKDKYVITLSLENGKVISSDARGEAIGIGSRTYVLTYALNPDLVGAYALAADDHTYKMTFSIEEPKLEVEIVDSDEKKTDNKYFVKDGYSPKLQAKVNETRVDGSNENKPALEREEFYELKYNWIHEGESLDITGSVLDFQSIGDSKFTEKDAGEYTLIVTATITDIGRQQDWYINADAAKQAEYQSLIARATYTIEITKVSFDKVGFVDDKTPVEEVASPEGAEELVYGGTAGNRISAKITASDIQSYSVCYREVVDGKEQEEKVLKTITLNDTDRALFARGQYIGDKYNGIDLGTLDAGEYKFYVRVETSDESANSNKVTLTVNPKPIADTAFAKSLLLESIQYGDKYSDAKVSITGNDEVNSMVQLKVKEEDVAKKVGPVNVTVVVANAENLKNYSLSGTWEFKQVLDVTAYAATVQLHDKTIALGATPTFDASDWEADIRNVNGETKDKVFKVNFRLDDGTPVSAMKNLAPGQYKLMADVDSLDSNYSVGKVEPATLTVGDGGTETNGIQFNKKQIVFTNIGKTREFAAAVVPATESNAGLTFESSDEGVATVKVTDAENGKAVVTAVANGEADIVVTAPNGVSGKLHVTVKQEPKKVVISRSGKTVSGTISVSVGKKYNFDAKVQPSTVYKKGVTWSTSNAKIATVSKKGKVTVKAAGTVKIKATAKGGAKSKTITLKAK